MKRIVPYATLVLLFVSVITFLLVKRSTTVPLKFSTKDIPNHNLVIVTPSDSEFAQLRTKLTGKTATEELDLPYVFVKNMDQKRRVIAYTLKWSIPQANGQVITRTRSVCREDLLAGREGVVGADDLTLYPQTARLFSVSGFADGDEVSLTGDARVVNKNAEAVSNIVKTGVPARINEQLNNTHSIAVSIDSALFDDGDFVGPNTTKHLERIEAQIQAKRKIMREVFQRLKGKETYSAVMKSLIERHEKLSKLEMGPSPEPDIEEIQRRSDKRYLDQILEMQRGFGSDELALRQFLWTNHKDRYLAIRKVDH
jgi:hypothetical protein